MGLDGVQNIVDIEDCFDIQIADQDAAQIETMQHLYDHVYSIVKTENPKTCLNQIVFFRLRKFFTNRDPALQNSFSPSMKISDLFSKRELKMVVLEIASSLKLNVPRINTSFLVRVEDLRYSEKIQDMADRIVKQNMKVLSSVHGISYATVVGVVRGIVHDISGVNRDKIAPGARIAYDLGID